MNTRQPVQTAALLIGAVFLLVGIAGFIPGITTHYGDLGFANHDGAELLGIFGVNVLHNIAHIALGIAGVALAKTTASARSYLLAGGAVYALLFVYGIVVDKGSGANFAALNTADNVLHFGLALAMVGLGLALPRRAHGERRYTQTA
jgi:hypothetical protein